MKKQFSILAILAMATTATLAQSDYVPLTMPASVAVAGVSNINEVIDVTKQASVSFVLTVKQSAAGTNGPIKLLFDYSNDRLKWTGATKPVTFAATGLTELVGQTNLSTFGARYLRLKSVENADSGAITNITANYAIKVGAP